MAYRQICNVGMNSNNIQIKRKLLFPVDENDDSEPMMPSESIAATDVDFWSMKQSETLMKLDSLISNTETDYISETVNEEENDFCEPSYLDYYTIDKPIVVDCNGTVNEEENDSCESYPDYTIDKPAVVDCNGTVNILPLNTVPMIDQSVIEYYQSRGQPLQLDDVTVNIIDTPAIVGVAKVFLPVSKIPISVVDETNTFVTGSMDKSTFHCTPIEIRMQLNDRQYYEEHFDHTVPTAAGGRRTKRFLCIFCKKQVAKLPNHLEAMHKNEMDVQQMLSYPKGSNERKGSLANIRNKGIFFWNDNRALNNGELSVARRPSGTQSRDGALYTPCPHCGKYFIKRRLHRHFKLCSSSQAKRIDRELVPVSKRLRGDLHRDACAILRNRVFPYLTDDAVTRAIRYDHLAIAYGNYLCARYSSSAHHDKMIRANLRRVGSLLLAARSIRPDVQSLGSLITPSSYKLVLEAIKKVAGLCSEERQYRAPSTAANLFTISKYLANVWISECLTQNNSQAVKDADKFLLLMKMNGHLINKTVVENQIQRQRRKQIVLPVTEDITKLTKYLKQGYKQFQEKLNANVNYQNWKQLAAYVMISVGLFNRRRPGELERIELEDFKTCSIEDNENHPDYDKKKNTVRNYTLFGIRGKLNRTVPVLFNRGMKKALDAVVQYRTEVGVPESNPYLFGIPGGNGIRHKYLSACEYFRKFSVDCGAKQPHSLRATILRKQLATDAAESHLPSEEVEDLANHMGHEKAIHRNIYRQMTETREVTGVMKSLKHAQGDPNADESSDDEVIEPVQWTPPKTRQSTSRESDTVTEDINNQWFTPPPQRTRAPKKKSTSKQFLNQTEITNNDLLVPSPQRSTKQHTDRSSSSNKSSDEGSDNLYVPSPSSEKWNSPKGRKRQASKSPKYKIRAVQQRVRWSAAALTTVRKVFAVHIRNGKLPSFEECRMARLENAPLNNRSSPCIKTCVHNIIRREKAQYAKRLF